MSAPLLSVITVVRNDRAGFLRTFDSVMAQDLDGIEYIVIDGASTDGTADLIQARAELLDAWISEPDQGVYDAMNKGWRKASGEWVVFLNAGDVFRGPEVASRMLAAADPSLDAIYGDAYFVLEDGRSHLMRASGPKDLPMGPFCSHQSLFLRRTWLHRLDGFRLDEWPASDYGLIARADAAGCRWGKVPLAVVDYALGGLSDRHARKGHLAAWAISRAVYGRTMWRDVRWAYQILRDFLREGLRKAGMGSLVLWYQTVMARARATER